MNRDLKLAVLSMDSYENKIIGSEIGTATIVKTSANNSNGFYGVAYTYNGETIISYRGTDDLSDVWYGWGGGVGAVRSLDQLS